MILLLLLSVLSIGQESLTTKYPYAQIRNNELEFVFSNKQELELRKVSESKKHCAQYVDFLTDQVYKRDSVIFELTQINAIYSQKDIENQKQEKLASDKFRVLNAKVIDLQENNTQLIIENKDLQLKAANWKLRTYGAGTIALAAILLKVLL